MKKPCFKYLVSGSAAGAVNGLLGAGGGMVLVPLLLKWCGMEEKKALATCVAVITPLCVISATVYFLKGCSVPENLLGYALGGLVGGAVGGVMLGKLPATFLIKAFGALMIFSGVKMTFWS